MDRDKTNLENYIDFDGRRYLYQYVRTDLGIFGHHGSEGCEKSL